MAFDVWAQTRLSDKEVGSSFSISGGRAMGIIENTVDESDKRFATYVAGLVSV